LNRRTFNTGRYLNKNIPIVHNVTARWRQQ